ncbi:MAG: methionine adenosyltransferase [Sphingomonas aquatilis]|uniref:S-adenosylmethionine synthase n=2 Tax=Sphingomonas TaxID=13687 RepID=A0A175Y4J3_9SPHN|nr:MULTISPECIES: methionine adenosyltransferase [Sphingomonas]ATI57392.1 methionine adenosyltransferase [Sphingomonas melonis]KZB95276.1 methionine adenosyltransferase [Sphingomonas melonis TY]MBB3875751.1 S-adenosylmethionine synthetase [Sphingomonas aquatilis]MBI0531460.1 methionine adenosyltransferase [Sphingomonas sp. TX0522]MBX8843805.1 methionine adenosyltransferase [Sphingomonas melonis]
MRGNYIFTSESVSEGHPDKVADQISDTIVDLFLSKDPEARIACETLTTTNLVVLAGEIRCKGVYENNAWADGALAEIEAAVRATVKRIGYEQSGFHWNEFTFENNLHGQSAEIAMGVDEGSNKDEGAGDQGIMFGYATDETPGLMPATLYYSHKILETMAADRHSGKAPFLEPDAKSQVTLQYENGVPVRATALVVSTQHKAGYCLQGQNADPAKYEELRAYVTGVLTDVLPDGFVTDETKVYINPTGAFEIGGPDGDAGLTGRKIIVDTYGGAAPHGGGAFSGKDPTKVDRSAAYVARYLAKNVVAAGLAKRCTIQLSYAIGIAEPLSVYVDTHGTGTVAEDKLEAVLPQLVRLTPKGIRQHLKLNAPIYVKSAAYGHFGREPEGDLFTWEKTDLVDALKAAVA